MVICAWCDEPLDFPLTPTKARPPATVSHGICRACLAHQITALPALAEPPLTGGRVLPLAAAGG